MNRYDSWITGHHVYQHVWTPEIGEKLDCRHDRNNKYDSRAIGVYHNATLVGHVPRELTTLFFRHLQGGGSIQVTITGRRGNTQNRGLEVPGTYVLIE